MNKEIIQIFRVGDTAAEVSEYLKKKWVEDGIFYVETTDDAGHTHITGMPLHQLSMIRIFRTNDRGI